MQAKLNPDKTSPPLPEPKERFADILQFKTFGDPELLKAAESCAEWLAAFDAGQEPRWITLLGSPGTGKTHLAKRMWKYAWTHSDFSATEYPPKALYWPEYVSLLRTGEWFAHRTDLRRWPVLFLDDIGAERDTTGFASEELNTLLGCRVGRWTILTSNLTHERLAAIDRRIASRLIRDRNICVGIKTDDFATR